MESVTLTQREMARLQVLDSLLTQQVTTKQAATLMGASARHTRRLLGAYRKEGAAALDHGSRGREPANVTPDSVIAEVVHLARTRYRGANHTHLGELLGEREGIEIGRTKLRRILVCAGLASPRHRRPPTHRIRRQWMPREGMLGPTGRQSSQVAGRQGTAHDYSRSPQAKGRVGRMAGTFQDRLITELRLAGASTIPATVQRAVQGAGPGSQRGCRYSGSIGHAYSGTRYHFGQVGEHA